MMKNKALIYLLLMGSALVSTVSCTSDFDKINQDPKIVNNPDLGFLLSYSEDKIVTYQGTEWIWESLEQLLRYSQLMTASPFEISGNVNTRYGAFYKDIMPNLVEIRRQIDAKADKDKYQKMGAVTYILGIVQGLKVTDMDGSMPYTQALQGRYDELYDPVYDDQKTLFDTWIAELDDAIQALESNPATEQESYGSADIFYKSDWSKWVKLANTLKLRIAVRYETQDQDMAKNIFQSVMTDAIGPMMSDDDQMVYNNPDYSPFNPPDINYRSPRYATKSIIDFMKKTEDPRMAIYFEPNDLADSYADSLQKYSVQLPSFIDPNDPEIQFQGGPADWTVDPVRASYIDNALAVGPNRYFLISPANKLFFSPKYQGADGTFLNVLVTHAESCFYIAGFIEKGYGAGIDTKGSADDWYQQGIKSSILTMNMIAKAAGSPTAFTDDGSATVNAYLDQPMVKLDGTNDLERIYIQEYLNFYRLANEAFTFCRVTGYPRNNSNYYARETFNETIARRFWLDDPGEVNRENWMQAQEGQGFTPGSRDLVDLNAQRLWFDKNSPDFGEGQ